MCIQPLNPLPQREGRKWRFCFYIRTPLAPHKVLSECFNIKETDHLSNLICTTQTESHMRQAYIFYKSSYTQLQKKGYTLSFGGQVLKTYIM